MTDRVKCIECDLMILPRTAADNDGLCAVCVQLSVELRKKIRDYKAQLADGSIFIPSSQALAGSEVPAALLSGDWKLHPEYYEDAEFSNPKEAIEAARNRSEGNVFLSLDDNVELNLGFNDKYAVCEYRDPGNSNFRYAHGDENLRQQVESELHIEQRCACCGEGLLWFPSRFHMPRELGFKIIENAVLNQPTDNVLWLECGDITQAGPDRG